MAQLNDIERRKIDAALQKWVDDEAMSGEDFERILWLLQNRQLKLSAMDNPRAATLQVRFRAILQDLSQPKSQGG